MDQQPENSQVTKQRWLNIGISKGFAIRGFLWILFTILNLQLHTIGNIFDKRFSDQDDKLDKIAKKQDEQSAAINKLASNVNVINYALGIRTTGTDPEFSNMSFLTEKRKIHEQ